METFLKLLFYAGVVCGAVYVDTLRGTDWLFATVVVWIAIGIYCYIRFFVLKDMSVKPYDNTELIKEPWRYR